MHTAAINSGDDLVERIHNGNLEVGNQLFLRYRWLIFSVAIKILHNRAEAEDIVQEVIIEVLQKLHQYDASRGTVKMWLLQRAYSRSLNRRIALQSRVSREEKVVPVESQELEDPVKLYEKQLKVRAALNALTAKQRLVIELAFFSGLSMQEISERTGQTFGNVRNLYYRGLEQMRTILESISVSQK